MEDISQENVLVALIEKRSELDGNYAKLALQLAKIKADIEHIDGAINIFHSSSRSNNRSHEKQNSVVKALKLERGNLASTALSIIENEGAPITSKKIAHTIFSHQGIPPDDDLIARLSCIITGALRRLLRSGKVINMGKTGNGALLWSAGAPTSSSDVPQTTTRLSPDAGQ